MASMLEVGLKMGRTIGRGVESGHRFDDVACEGAVRRQGAQQDGRRGHLDGVEQSDGRATG
jgi:hypothetical protein